MTGDRSTPSEPSGLGARRAALRLLDAVLRRGEPLEQAEPAACRELVLRADKALALAIAGEVLRHLPGLDALIDSATRQLLPDDAKARMVLRIALAQALALGTPPHAAIGTALPLVAGGPRRLVHGVFGTVLRGKATLPPAALPAPVAERWRTAWGPAMVEAGAAALATPPPLDLTVRSEAAIAPAGESLLDGHVRLARGGPVEALPGFAEGGWWVQDLAASLPARLLGLGQGRAALDLCAAPGGKTMQLAAAGWRVTAIDQSARRLKRLRDNLSRTGLAAETQVADLERWEPDRPASAILLDAPCSATGIFRRHPDVLYRVNADVIAVSAERQRALLTRALDWLAPDGRLAYAVCSLEPEEGEQLVTAVLAEQPDFAIDQVAIEALPPGVAPSPEGWVRTLPGQLADRGGLDGFFMVRLRRAG